MVPNSITCLFRLLLGWRVRNGEHIDVKISADLPADADTVATELHEIEQDSSPQKNVLYVCGQAHAADRQKPVDIEVNTEHQQARHHHTRVHHFQGGLRHARHNKIARQFRRARSECQHEQTRLFVE